MSGGVRQHLDPADRGAAKLGGLLSRATLTLRGTADHTACDP